MMFVGQKRGMGYGYKDHIKVDAYSAYVGRNLLEHVKNEVFEKRVCNKPLTKQRKKKRENPGFVVVSSTFWLYDNVHAWPDGVFHRDQARYIPCRADNFCRYCVLIRKEITVG